MLFFLIYFFQNLCHIEGGTLKFFNSFFGDHERGTYSQEERTLCSNCICTASDL